MTASILSFSLKSMICSGVFMAYYLLALKNARINSFNRIYLLTAVFLSLVLPIAQFDLLGASPVAVPEFPLLHITAKGAEEAVANVTATSNFNWQLVLVTIYFAVAATMVLRSAAKFVWAYHLKHKGQKIRQEDFLLVKTDDPRAPFSFMNMLFWPTHMRQDSPEGQGILMHELAHIKQRHTIDKIFMELMLAICWLNPFNWLMKKEVWLQHEFLADRYAIKDGDSDTFARMLLYSVTNSSERSIISPFFQSPVKRRLTMLTRTARSSYGFMRRFLSIPILFLAVVLMAADTKDATVVRSPKKITLVLDAAHGGEDAGGKSIYGHLEKDLTLAVCQKLVALSKEYNIHIISTRDKDVFQTLQERISTSNNTNDAIFLSVHVKKATDADAGDNNYELGIDPNSKNYSKSILLASSIADKLKNQNLPVTVVDNSKAYVIHENKNPALILECGNLDDADNIALLKDGARTEALCRNILSGIVDYNTRANTK